MNMKEFFPTNTGSLRTSLVSMVPPANPAAWASNALLDAEPIACFSRRCRASATSLSGKRTKMDMSYIIIMTCMYVCMYVC